VFFEYTKPTLNIASNDKVIVRFVLHNMANANEFWVVLEFFNLRFAVGAGKIDPADNARDPV